MVKHMLRTNTLLTLHIMSSFVQSPCLFFSCMRTVLYPPKKRKRRRRRHCADDRFAQCSLLGLSTTALYFHSNWGTEVCSLLPSVEWFFMTLGMKESPVSVLYALSLWPAVVSSPSPSWKLQPFRVHRFIYFSWKFRSTIKSKLTVETGRPTSIPESPLERYVILLLSLVLFHHWHDPPHHPCLCWLAVRARSDRHLRSLRWWSIWPGPPLMPCLKKHLNS